MADLLIAPLRHCMKGILVVSLLSLTIGILLPLDVERAHADYGGYPYCAESPVDIGQAGGVVYSNYIWAQAQPTCSPPRAIAYDFHTSTSPNVMTYIYVDYARGWWCGQWIFNDTPPPFDNVQGTSQTSFFCDNDSCGLQADQHVEFYKTGVLDQWSYTNF